MAQVLAPQSRIIGIDLVPPTNERSGLPTQSIPANVTYKRGDILAPLDFADQQFDYIYQRDVAHVVPKKHWPSLIREFHRVLRPGGKLELVEYGKHDGWVVDILGCVTQTSVYGCRYALQKSWPRACVSQ